MRIRPLARHIAGTTRARVGTYTRQVTGTCRVRAAANAWTRLLAQAAQVGGLGLRGRLLPQQLGLDLLQAASGEREKRRNRTRPGKGSHQGGWLLARQRAKSHGCKAAPSPSNKRSRRLEQGHAKHATRGPPAVHQHYHHQKQLVTWLRNTPDQPPHLLRSPGQAAKGKTPHTELFRSSSSPAAHLSVPFLPIPKKPMRPEAWSAVAVKSSCRSASRPCILPSTFSSRCSTLGSALPAPTCGAPSTQGELVQVNPVLVGKRGGACTRTCTMMMMNTP